MQRLNLESFLSSFHAFGSLQQSIALMGPPPADMLAPFIEHADAIERHCRSLGLVVNLSTATDIKNRLQKMDAATPNVVSVLINTLLYNIEKEVSYDHILLKVDADIAKYIDLNQIEAPTEYIRNHIHSAGKSLAYEMPDACVYHLMLAVEAGVQLFAKKSNVKIISTGKKIREKQWGQLLNEVGVAIKSFPQINIRQKRKHERYSATQSYLYHVKDAWRNPTLHPREAGYNLLEALDITNHVRAFMRSLKHL